METKNTMKTKRIQYDDDLVIVYDEAGRVAYKGMEDYDPNKDLDWRWNAAEGCYTYLGWKKICIA